jgi:hypothetical protein
MTLGPYLRQKGSCPEKDLPQEDQQVCDDEQQKNVRLILNRILATAQSLMLRQMNFDAKMDDLARKPQSHITQEDALEFQLAEVALN